ncbi:zinc finger protein PLAGL2-like [Salvelinus namaycush]|uniref:Zinc finger protein PLAGL2-like n=1 Tax=Salvelinus namaycush TaxID=8040 RepID=A0A8U1EZJ4_SALNM|nr:zinc finger protein PLAGL2-like [Salvelinus namaycush]
MFQQKEHLKSHLQAHDANRQVFHCQECGKQYSTQLGYRRHLLAAHAPASSATIPEELHCQEGAPALLEQLGSHTDRLPPLEVTATVRERKYSCERCDRRFYTRKDVRRHAVVHTGRRDFLCPRCAQRFGRRDHLTRHLKKSHIQEPTTTTPTPAPTTPGPVKEETSPVQCSNGPSSKEHVEAFPIDMYSSYPLQTMSNPGMGHQHHSLMQGSLPTAMGVGLNMPGPSPHPHHHLPQQQQQPYGHMARYQHGSTSYPRTDMESFLMDLQSGLPPHLTTASSSTSSSASPQREVLSETQGGPVAGDPHLLSRSPALSSAELSCAANMDLGPLLGFLPFSLPPYSAHMSMGGLVMGYPSTSTSTVPPSSSSPLPYQAPGGLTFLQPPQLHASQGPGAHNHNNNQLPQGFSNPGMSTSTSLPRYYQTFQQ